MSKWNFYTAREIKPKGWLRRQLEIQAEGLGGHLDKIWPDVRDSAWIGGDRDGWERVPYWLDGFIPLAYLLEDRDMIARAKKYIDAILAAQKPDGWICPCRDEERSNYDLWAVHLISKVLVNYYECSGDERIPEVLYRVLKNYYELLKSGGVKLGGWGMFRWYEGLIAIDFTYKRYPEDWLPALASMLKEGGCDYTDFIEQWKRPLNRWRLETHIVNITMALKQEVVACDLLHLPYTDQAEELRTILDRYNGTPVGLFTGDECLSGLSPVQGTELCAVVEQMYSYELLYAYTGDRKWAERLEVLAFNALPATLSDDMWCHQYVQQSNQIACERFPGKSYFRTNNEEAHLFGLEPNFGCCTANFHQGWPKFTLSAFMHGDGRIINSLPIPSELTCGGKQITLETDYPFENSLHYTVKSDEDFTFVVRIPSFAQNLRVNGESVSDDGELTFAVKAGDDRRIDIDFEVQPEVMARPYDLTTVKCGSLVFSVPVRYERKMHEYEKDGVIRKFPYCDYEYLPLSDWNYAYVGEKFTRLPSRVSDIPFSSEHPPVALKAKVCKIDWGLADGYESVCAPQPQSRVPLSEPEDILLVPYGCAKLRMTELPLIKE